MSRFGKFHLAVFVVIMGGPVALLVAGLMNHIIPLGWALGVGVASGAIAALGLLRALDTPAHQRPY